MHPIIGLFIDQPFISFLPYSLLFIIPHWSNHPIIGLFIHSFIHPSDISHLCIDLLIWLLEQSPFRAAVRAAGGSNRLTPSRKRRRRAPRTPPYRRSRCRRRPCCWTPTRRRRLPPTARRRSGQRAAASGPSPPPTTAAPSGQGFHRGCRPPLWAMFLARLGNREDRKLTPKLSSTLERQLPTSVNSKSRGPADRTANCAGNGSRLHPN